MVSADAPPRRGAQGTRVLLSASAPAYQPRPTLAAARPAFAPPPRLLRAPAPAAAPRLVRTATADPRHVRVVSAAAVGPLARTVTAGPRLVACGPSTVAGPRVVVVRSARAGRTVAPVPGLSSVLCECGLTAKAEAAEKWVDEMGACDLEEIVENVDDFSKALGLAAQETERLRTAASSAAAAARQEAHASKARIPTALSTPVTAAEHARAKESLCLSLFDHVAGSAESSEDAAALDEALEQEEAVQGADVTVRGRLRRENKGEKKARFRWATPPRHRWRVDEHLLRQRIPTEAELKAVENAKAAAEAAVIAEWGEPEPEQEESQLGKSRRRPFRRRRKPESNDPFESFRSLRAAFLREYGSAIRLELGQDVTIEPADVSENVQNKFMQTVRTNGWGMLPTFGYHGTKNSRIPSILERGLLVPGHASGISVANGSAHGVGIYTGLPGAAGLSRGFCDSSNMLICGVVDPAATPVAHVEEEEAEAQLDNPSAAQVAPRVIRRVGGQGGHRNHHRPVQHVVQVAPMRPASGGWQGWPCENRENSVLRVAGAARIFFDDSYVAPLFVAQQHTATNAVPYPGKWAPVPTRDRAAGTPLESNTNKAGQVWVGRQRVFIKESGQRVWLPPQPTRGWNEVHVKRRVVARERDQKRAVERTTKASQDSW